MMVLKGDIPQNDRIETETDEDTAGNIAEDDFMLCKNPEPPLQEMGGIGHRQHRDRQPEGIEAEQDGAPRQLTAGADHREDA
jgi:hypothetical protein